MYQSNDYYRINGWLLAPAAYLIMTLIAASLMLVLYAMMFIYKNQAIHQFDDSFTLMWYLSVLTTTMMWCFTVWVLRLLFIRSKRFPRIFIIWLMVSVLIAIKTFAFSPITDEMAIRSLLWPLLAAAIFVPYIQRSHRVKMTFTQDR
ncbi:DUF2569 domain-containing protein [Xenorhabdus nematophila]|uniref:Oxidoreductase n=1 Tax=Xenorhabdus nematophila (strain ATCC 19061 / DSM 3370 / CCUG 14189 / LMG 1036 / NCIMB 9965 / AN6) TaxID=406817 RepID=D3VGE3_XENNA|nr:DUF2569 domain-containing protein [Xenorhabdus nematophila]CEE89955.1 putative oxidoreductase [Xenorhabdus nematophila str. Anatoliense]CEF29493.1 putative oxidoreductase [Xenorhabdus nematophila str. Websteri]AYA40178.1 DUF2569 domain-containing protein [Xenorhabdus nematophila]KHD27399.1 membrane protein [Xenorhabdus nematophila]MBA0018847.1 DUF2569 domain-containing protein [Xenorhabdus nematophila]